MALVKCSECDKNISDKAVACPNCGSPINNNRVEFFTSPRKPIQIEPVLTSKKWKKVKLWSWGAIIFGLILMGVSGGEHNSLVYWVGFCFIGYGIIALIIGKIGAWYSDKRTR
jgi:hypothetical protein